MYTELVFGAELNGNPGEDNEVVRVLRFLCGDTDVVPDPPPDHPFFSTDRWRFIGTGGSYSFPVTSPHSAVLRDRGNGSVSVSMRCSLKNYAPTIERFLEWIAPYVTNAYPEFYGYMMYEDAEAPTLIWMWNDGAAHPQVRYQLVSAEWLAQEGL